MNKKTVKKIFIFFLIFLPLQYAIVGIVGPYKGEPWPALVLPGFKSVVSSPRDSVVLAPQFITETNKGSQKLNLSQLFKELSAPQLAHFLEANFSDSVQIKNLSLSAKQWLQENISRHMSDSTRPEVLHIQWVRKSLKLQKPSLKKRRTQVKKNFKILF